MSKLTAQTILEKIETDEEANEALTKLINQVNDNTFSFSYYDAYDTLETIVAFLDVNFNLSFSIAPYVSQSDGDYSWHALTYQPVGKDKRSRTIIWQYDYQDRIDFTDKIAFLNSLLATHYDILNNF